ncbi:MAG: 50S ribosomal protein L13, partial [Thermoplasmata archaeon]
RAPTSSSPPKSAAAPAVRPTAPPRAEKVPSGVVVDASGLVLGRAASVIAKRLLKGEHIVVVNAEHSVVVGERSMVLETYRADRARGSKRTGPHFPRYPDRIFRRTVRGMLPHLKSRGQAALDRLQVHIGIPPEYEGRGRETIDVAQVRPALRRPITLGEISRFLGARV